MPNKPMLLNCIAEQLLALAKTRRRLLAGNDAEALHDMRIALRSLRALLPVILKKNKRVDAAILAAWKALSKLTGPTRDAEVLLALLGDQAKQSAALRKTQQDGYQALLEALIGNEFSQLGLLTLVRSEKRLIACSAATIAQRIKIHATRFQRELLSSTAIITPNIEQWHARRIAVKHLRYLSELTQQPKRYTRLNSQLKTAQAAIGDLHDAALLAQLTGKKINTKKLMTRAEKSWQDLSKKL